MNANSITIIMLFGCVVGFYTIALSRIEAITILGYAIVIVSATIAINNILILMNLPNSHEIFVLSIALSWAVAWCIHYNKNKSKA